MRAVMSLRASSACCEGTRERECMRGETMAQTVADEWKHGRPFGTKQDSMTTDGFTVWSYAHVIGTTGENGEKIAQDCHYSHTTARHSTALAVVADEVIPCTQHTGRR